MQKQKGFSFLELIVIVAVIGLLVTTALISLGNARIKAQDAKRFADLRSIEKAVQSYFNDHNHTYPASESSWVDFMDQLALSLNNKVLRDPVNNVSSHYTYCWNAGGSKYFISANFEQPLISGFVSGAISFDTTGGGCIASDDLPATASGVCGPTRLCLGFPFN